MKQYMQWLPFPSATIVVLAFFLPWFSVSCKHNITQQEQKVAFTGYHFASGKMPPLIDGMLQIQEKLAGFGQFMTQFFQKKTTSSPPAKKNPIAVLRQGFTSYRFAIASFAIAALLGLWFAIFGPTLGLRLAGTCAVLVGIFCLMYPALNRPPELHTQKLNIKFLSIQLEYGGYLLLSGIVGTLVGFWVTPSVPPLPKLVVKHDRV